MWDDVERLERLSFQTLCKGIVCGSPLYFGNAENTFSVDSDARDCYLRDLLRKSLIGTVGVQVRRELVEEFMLHRDPVRRRIAIEFLRAVLDDSFQDVRINLCGRCVPASVVLDTIVEQAPFVQNLVLFGSVCKEHFPSMDMANSLRHYASFERLSNLTSLSVKGIMLDTEHLKQLGNVRLKRFQFHPLIFSGAKYLLHLFMGQNANIIDKLEIKSEELRVYQFPEHMLTPICQTLTDLILSVDFPTFSYSDENIFCYSDCYAFVLRHVPGLRTLCTPLLDRAIHHLFQTRTYDFVAAQMVNSDALLPDAVKQSPFTGTLALRSVQGLRGELETVATLCPLLENIHLYLPSCSQLGFLFSENAWSKLQHLDIEGNGGIGHETTHEIITKVGPRLKSLTLSACRGINLSDFLSCPQLVKLEITGRSALETVENFSVAPDTFLPNLKWIHSDVCLGSASAFFLRKQSLVHISLTCFNLFTCPAEWQTIVQLWPCLRYFRIGKCKGLSGCLVQNLFPMFEELKALYLPNYCYISSPLLRRRFRSRQSILGTARCFAVCSVGCPYYSLIDHVILQ